MEEEDADDGVVVVVVVVVKKRNSRKLAFSFMCCMVWCMRCHTSGGRCCDRGVPNKS